ncbi:hypothetical protein [Variovorax sp. PAMC 28711]|uniref:hypothetical protein n=1 Tax=Variovorax sp. PAMC 28711 TaxID=1795631 RepID=UPI000AFEB4F7|nr:hypothetical protein [Variovorax sp. PAMC 28711]
MADFDWRATIGAVAPGLANALGGPLAGAAVKIIADKVLGRPDASAQDVEDALSSGTLSGEQIVALRSAEKDFEVEMAKVDQAREAAYIDDTKSARQQTVDLTKSGSGIAFGAPVVSTLIVVGYFFCIYRLFIVQADLPANAFQLLNVMFGALSLAFGQVCNYWLGSSAGSKRSGDAVRKIAEQAQR